MILGKIIIASAKNLILSATLLRLISPSTVSWSRETVSSKKVPRYLFIRYLPALFLNASEKLVYHAAQAMVLGGKPGQW